jgi:hypothetical protein
MSLPEAVVLASISVLGAALAGGFVGGVVRRRYRATGAIIALAIAWPVGIALLPAAASLLGFHVAAGIFCFDTCTPMVTSADPTSGIVAYANSTFMTTFPQVGLFGAVIGGSLVIAGTAFRWWLGVVVAIVVYGALHAMSLLFGGWPAYACLGAGILTWSLALERVGDRA